MRLMDLCTYFEFNDQVLAVWYDSYFRSFERNLTQNQKNFNSAKADSCYCHVTSSLDSSYGHAKGEALN